jgi:hypothetical protein
LSTVNFDLRNAAQGHIVIGSNRVVHIGFFILSLLRGLQPNRIGRRFEFIAP